MKTKNIFRMLLVAAALLMGANNVKADITLYDSEWSDSFDFPASAFNNVTSGSRIQMYTRQGSGNLYNFGSPYHSYGTDNIYGGDVANYYHSDGGYIEFLITPEWLTTLQSEGLTFTTEYNAMMNKIIIVSSSTTEENNNEGNNNEGNNNEENNNEETSELDTTPFSAGKHTIWPLNDENPMQLNWNENKYISFSTDLFYKARTGNTVRIYGSINDASNWQLRVSKEHQAITISGWNDGTVNTWSDARLYSTLASDGYIEFSLDDTNLGEFQSVNTAYLYGINFTVTEVAIYVATPPVSYNITYESNNAHGSFAENNPTEAIAGNTVTVEIEEDEGWLGIVTATYGDDNTSLNVSTGTQAGQYTFIMPDADVSVYLSFERLYTVTADATEHGTINLADETYFRANTEYSFSVTPADNYEISADDISVYTGEGEDREEIEFTQRSGSSNSYFFTMPEANVHISATFHAVQQEPVEITLAFSTSRVEYDINSSTAFVAPTLTANGQAVSADLGIVYSSSRTSVAEVDPVTGEVEIYGTGTTVITATFPDDSNYTGSAEYTLYVYEIAEDGDWEEVSFVNGETTYEYRTYVTPGVIDFGRSDHVEAYYATGYDDEVVEFTQVLSTCAAGTPLLLKKTGNNCKLWLLTDDDATGSELTGNLLRPGSTNEEGEAEEVSGPNKYVLTIHNEEPVFAEVKNHAANVDANHAYLYLGTNAPASGRLRVKFSDESTGISIIKAETNDGVIYNLRGQRVENPTKGLYIINGKKVVIK